MLFQNLFFTEPLHLVSDMKKKMCFSNRSVLKTNNEKLKNSLTLEIVIHFCEAYIKRIY